MTGLDNMIRYDTLEEFHVDWTAERVS